MGGTKLTNRQGTCSVKQSNIEGIKKERTYIGWVDVKKLESK